MDATQQAPPGVSVLLDASRPRFSDGERRHRRAAVTGLLDAHDLDASLVHGVLVTATGHERLHTTAPGVIAAGTTATVRA